MQVTGQLAASLFRLALLIVIGILVAPVPVAAQRQIDPREIALTPADLPSGFSVDQSQTGYRRLADDTLTYQVQMGREPTRENLLDGPILVRQLIFRAGGEIGPGEGLALIRDVLLEEGFQPTIQGPNDGGTVSLASTIPVPDADADVTVYAVGFVKDRFVIYTVWAGLEELVDFQRLLTLAGVSSAKLDAALRR